MKKGEIKMDYKEEYEKALERAKKGLPIDEVFPELKESEDERIRKFLLEYAIEMIAGLESDISLSTYDGIKGHDPDAEAELNQWQKARAYLEKQKEQEPVKIYNPTDKELEAHHKQLHDFKVFAAKQAREHHISFVHDFEWDTFCGELLSYFNEQQKPAEWREEDEKIFNSLCTVLHGGLSSIPTEKFISWLKSLHPHWKPSEEQMEALRHYVDTTTDGGIELLYNDLKKLI